MRKVLVDGVPHLYLFAAKDIEVGEELRYDYGLHHLPWRIQVFIKNGLWTIHFH